VLAGGAFITAAAKRSAGHSNDRNIDQYQSDFRSGTYSAPLPWLVTMVLFLVIGRELWLPRVVGTLQRPHPRVHFELARLDLPKSSHLTKRKEAMRQSCFF
jgi:hypothetical protein